MILQQHSRYQHELKRMITYVKKKAYNSYVQQFVNYPPLDIFQLHFTYLFLSSKDLSLDIKETICISQLFIQLGLDCHEQIGLGALEGDLIKNRQLTVLSGDYFSGFYYLFLAERKQIDLIRKWAQAIQDINELKTELHTHSAPLSKQEACNKRVEMKGKLTVSVLDWYKASDEWYTLHSLLLKLFMLHSDSSQNQKELEPLLAELQQKMQNNKDELLTSELKLWVDLLQQSLLVIEP